MTATMHYVKPSSKAKKPILAEAVRTLLSDYYKSLKGETPSSVYNLVMTEIERPLIEETLKFTNNNQSKAAEMLGLNRGTFRKKMSFYGLL